MTKKRSRRVRKYWQRSCEKLALQIEDEASRLEHLEVVSQWMAFHLQWMASRKSWSWGRRFRELRAWLRREERDTQRQVRQLTYDPLRAVGATALEAFQIANAYLYFAYPLEAMNAGARPPGLSNELHQLVSAANHAREGWA